MTTLSWIIIGIGAILCAVVILGRERAHRKARMRRMKPTKFPPGRRRAF